MNPRQLVRVGAVLVAALALCFLGWRGAHNDPAPTSTADPTSYAGVVEGLQRVLTGYGLAAQEVVQHDQAHLVESKLVGLEKTLILVRDRAAALDTEEGDQAAVLAEFVRLRGGQVRAAAAADHIGMTGIAALQAFGREVSMRADRIGAALDAAQDDDGEWADVELEVDRPWPVPEAEGLGS